MRLNKKQKKKFSKFMNSYLAMLSLSVEKVNHEKTRSQRYFSVRQAYVDVTSQDTFEWFVKQSRSDIKTLVGMSRMNKLNIFKNYKLSYLFKNILDFSYVKFIDDAIDKYKGYTDSDWNDLDKDSQNYFLTKLIYYSVYNVSNYNLTKLRDLILNHGLGLPLYLVITDDVFRPYFEKRLNSDTKFRERIFSIKNRKIINYSIDKLNDKSALSLFKAHLFNKDKSLNSNLIFPSKRSYLDFSDIIHYQFFTEYYPQHIRKKSLSPELKYNISKIICEKFLTLNFNDLEFLCLKNYIMSITEYMKYYLQRKTKKEIKSILNNFLRKRDKVIRDYNNKSLMKTNNPIIIMSSESTLDMFYSVKDNVINCLLKHLNHEDFVFYIKEVRNSRQKYFFKRAKLSKWC